MTKEDFDKWLAAISDDEKEPFCPFDFFGYCDSAYTEKCWSCEDREQKAYDVEEIHPNCTVQIWKNSVTGEESVGWWENVPEDTNNEI